MMSPFGQVFAAQFGPYALPNGTEPLIFLDFKNGVYTSDGVTVTLADLLVENSDYGSWNPARIQAGVGLVGNTDTAPVFTNDALDLTLAGSTIVTVLSYNGAVTGDNFRYEMVDNFIDYGLYYYSGTRINSEQDSYIGDQVSPDVTEPTLAVGSHEVALTMIAGKISRSTDGAAIITVNPAAAWTPTPGAMGFVAPSSWVIESIGLYPPQPDADLPTLSAL